MNSCHVERKVRKLMFLTAAWSVSLTAAGEGTKEVFWEGGLYSGTPSASLRTELYQWAASSVQVDAHWRGGQVPEGREALRFSVNSSWGGGGIFFVANNDPSQVL